MKYVCLGCGKKFMHPMRLTITQTSEPVKSQETHICPYCGAVEIDELRLEEQKITSVRQVDYADVDKMIAEGYDVAERYAKNVTMIKRAQKTEPISTVNEHKEEEYQDG